MSRINRVIIQNSLHQNINRNKVNNREPFGSLFLNSSLFLFWCREFWIITLFILLIVFILRKSKHLITGIAPNTARMCHLWGLFLFPCVSQKKYDLVIYNYESFMQSNIGDCKKISLYKYKQIWLLLFDDTR